MKKSSKPEEYSQDMYATAAAEEPSESPASPDSSESSRAEAASGKENKVYLTREKLLTVKDDSLRRQLAPMKKWSSLTTGYPYLLKRIISMEVKKFGDGNEASSSTSSGSCKETSYYAELESQTDSLINVWITPIMLAESENYNLASGDVYIVPLGKRLSQESKKEYHAFVILRGDELEFN